MPIARPNREFAPSATTTYVGPHLLPVHDRAAHEPAIEDRRGRLGVLPHRRAGLHRVVGDHLVEVAPAHDVPERREVGMLGPLELERDAVGERAQAVEPVEVLEALAESHVAQLAHCTRGKAITTGLLTRERLLLDDEDVVTRRCEPVGRRRARGAAAHHEHLVAARGGGHQDPLASPPAAAPSTVHCGGTGSCPDSTTRS